MSKFIEFRSWYQGTLVDRYINPDNVLFVEEGNHRDEARIILKNGCIDVKGRPDYVASLLGVK